MLLPGDRVTIRYRHIEGEYEAVVLQPESDGQVWVQALDDNRGGAAQVNTYRVVSTPPQQIRINLSI